MNKNLLLLGVSLFTYTANAQTVNISHAQARQLIAPRHNAVTQGILQKQTAHSKTTASHKRLMAQGFSLNNSGWQILDSSNYTYSNAHGSKFDFSDMYYSTYANNVQFDSMSTYGDFNGGVDLSSGNVRKYNSANDKMSDVYLESNPSGTPLKNSTQTLFVYDASGNLQTQYMFNWLKGTQKWDTSGRTDYIYNSSNKATLSTEYTKTAGKWKATNRNTMTYDGAGNLATQIYANWTGSAWVDNNRYTARYNSNNKLQGSSNEYYDGTTWIPSMVDTFGYNGRDFYVYNESKDWNADSNRWDNSYLEIKHTNALNLPDTVTQYQPDSATGVYVSSFVNVWSYDSDNNPIASEGYFDIMGTPILFLRTNYYYETYWDLAVKDVADNKGFRLYPNPAGNVININADKPFANNATATVLNTAGQVLQKTDIASGSSNVSLSLNSMQPGTYFVLLADAQGNKLYTQQIVKQ